MFQRAFFRTAFATVLLATIPAATLADETSGRGRLVGQAINSENGLGVAGATVTVTGSAQSTATDLSGRFSLEDVSAGVHDLVATKDEFRPLTVAGVQVTAGGTAVVEIPMHPVQSVIRMEAMTVSADVVQNSGLGLLSARQKSAAVSDAICADQMSKLGFGTAAAAMRAVTGASVVGGKYVYIRGLGERYSSTMVNGAEVPSADPDRRAVNMDMFPSDLVDAIVTTKTFTPDKPGNFTGGAVDLKTKEFPEQFTAQLSASFGLNSRVTGKTFLTSGGGSNVWARDDGSRSLPAALAGQRIPLRFTEPGIDAQIGELTRAFSPIMAPRTKDAPLNQSFAAAVGGVAELFGRKLGYATSLSYDRTFSGYRGGVFGRYERQGTHSPALAPLVQLDDTRSEDDALIGALLNFTYQLTPDHQIAFNTMVNRAGNDLARRQTGLNVAGGGITEQEIFTTLTLRYTERSLQSFQLAGRHLFPAWRDLRVNWSITDATTTQDEPDTRYFSTFQTWDGNEFFEVSGVPRPSRYFRDLEESRRDYSFDVTLPVTTWGGRQSQLKFGGALARTWRNFSERLFEYNSTTLRYDGDEQNFLRESQVGQVDPATNRFRTGQLYLVETTSAGNSYDGEMDVDAVYAMADLSLTPRLRFIGGARAESTKLDVRSRDPGRRAGLLDDDDLLPSANLVYAFSKKMNVRAAVTRTIARPNFREIADYTSFEFVGDFVYIGNPDLRRTTITNYDLRWEWFPHKEELIAVSVFHKDMSDPIERGVFSVINSGEFQYQNAPSGRVTGVEFEARKNLGFLADWLRDFSGGLNYTYVESAVEISPAELAFIRFYEPEAGSTRELTGQSPYIFNADLTFTHPDWGSSVSAYFNLFGERLSQVSPPGTPNVFEQPAPTLDLIWNQKIGYRWKLTLSVKNVLDRPVEETYTYRGETYQRSSYKRGAVTSLGVTFTF